METVSIIGTKNRKGQVITDPRVMMNEAPRTASFFTGSEVIKEAVRRANVDIMVAYPITPQSEAAALCGELFAEGYIGDYFRGESEFDVMSQCAGSAFGGARVFTTTAGPGTMRAMENFPMWAGERLPIVSRAYFMDGGRNAVGADGRRPRDYSSSSCAGCTAGGISPRWR